MKRETPTHVGIDLSALRFNYRQLKKRIRPGVKSLCVVKSNAYGHGAVQVARVLEGEGADLFGVGTIDEAIELRQGKIKKPILILLGIVSAPVQSLVRYRLTPVIYDFKTAKRIHDDLARQHAKFRLPIHLKVDTGMTRLGVLPREMGDFCDRLKKLSRLEPAGLLTHLADAGEEAFSRRQVSLFEKGRREFQKRFPGDKLLHIANSQAVIDKKTPGNCVRLGIALYGSYPLERDRAKIALKPVLSWKTRLIATKKVPRGTPVSYGRTFCARKETLVGVVPVGYADGYLRLLSNRAEVLVRGRRVPVIGRICMDLMMVDLTSVPKIRGDEEVVLIGRQGREEIRAEEIAKKAGTISYEFFCRIAERIPRVYS